MPAQESAPAPESLSEESIREILKPLQQENASIEYICQQKAINEFNQRLRFLETLYADVFAKVAALENEIAAHKTSTPAPQHPAYNIWDKFS